MLNYVMEKADHMKSVSDVITNNIKYYEKTKEKSALEECQNMIFNLQGQLKAAQRELEREIERSNKWNW